jgi:hypothetical protein
MKSSTESDEPSATRPYIDREEPNRAKLRRDMVEPMVMKSNTDNEEPKQQTP